MNYTVVKIGKMASTNVDAYLKTVKLDVDVENGAHVVLGELVDDDLNCFVASTPTDVSAQEVLIVESPVLVEVEGMRIDLQDPRKFINRKGTPLRARHLKIGDEVTITANGFESAPEVGKFAAPVNGQYKLAPSSDPSGATVVYKVIAKTVISIANEFVEAYKLQVVKQA